MPGPTTSGRRRDASRLAPEQRLAAAAAFGLFVTMVLPWYSVTYGRTGRTRIFTAFGDFSFVEVAVLLVAISVGVLLFVRNTGRAFHLPGGDGTIVMVAGAWVAFLLFYRLIDKPGQNGGDVVGVRWGIFVALLDAGLLAYAGYRMRAAHRPEPPLPAERAPAAEESPPGRATREPVRRRGEEPTVRQPSPRGGEQQTEPAPRDAEEPTVALPGRRSAPRVPRPDDPPDPPSTLF